MTDTIRFVNPASAGGDGTGGIDVLSGTDAAYASRAAAEAAEQGTISSGDRLIIQCGGTANDIGSCTVSGWTITGALIFTSHVNYRHSGVWDDNKFSCVRANTSFNIAEENVAIEYIQFEQTSASTVRVAVAFGDPCDGGSFKRNIVRDTGGANKATALAVSRSGHVVDVCFNLILDCGIFTQDTSGSGTIASYYNNTIINTVDIYTFTKSSNKPIFKNNIIHGTTNGITGTMDSSSDFNATEDADFGTGYTTNTNDRVSQTFTFEDAGSDDYHLASGDTAAKDEGVDLSGVTDAIDIDGEAISDPWSIGADWVAASGDDISPTGIASEEAFGTAVLTTGAVTLSPTGIASAEAFGSHTVANVQVLSPSGIASEEAFGTAVLTTGAVTVSPSGIASEESFGAHNVSQATFLRPTGIASAEAFGVAEVAGDRDIKIDFQDSLILSADLQSTTLYFNGTNYFTI